MFPNRVFKVKILFPFLLSIPMLALGQNSPPSSVAQPYVELGASYFQAARYDIAIEEAQKALKADPNNPDAYVLLGSVYLSLQDFELAQKNLQLALQINAAHPDAHNNLGLLFCEQGKTKEALNSFAKALAAPRYSRASQTLTNTAICLQKNNDFIASEKYLVKALEVEPFSPLALYYLSISYLKQGRLELAKSRIEALHKQMAPNASTLAVLGTIELQQANPFGAQQYFQRILTQFPNSPEAKKIANQQDLY